MGRRSVSRCWLRLLFLTLGIGIGRSTASRFRLYPMKTLFAALAVCFATALSSASDSIEIFYFSDQETYRLAGFDERRLPILEESNDEVTEFTGVRDGTWHVRGELIMSADYAMPIVDYDVKRQVAPYAERGRANRYDVGYKYWSLLKTRPWLADLEEGTLFVTAWVAEGELSRFTVVPIGAASVSMPQTSYLTEDSKAGYPLVWLVREGALVEKDESLSFDSLLLDGGEQDLAAHLRTTDGSGRTLAHYLAANGFADELAAVVLQNKKSPKTADKMNKLPLSFAAVAGRSECARVLLEARSPRLDGWESLNVIAREAAMNGHREVVSILANGEKDRNLKWERSWALASASNSYHADIVEDLIGLGASVSIAKDKKAGSLFSIFSKGYPELAFLLLDHYKFKPKQVEFGGANLFHAVAGYADVELLETIRGFGIEMLAKSEKGAFPLDVAIAFGNVPGICWFLENGGRPDYETEKIVDPFKQAIQNGQLDSVSCLINYGYDVNGEISKGVTPLMYATYARNFGIAEALLEAGGVWEYEHSIVDVLLTRILEGDQLALLESLLDQGMPHDRKVFKELTLLEVADFFGADRCRAYLAQNGAAGSEKSVYQLASVETKPRLLKLAQVKYPEHLQEKHGSHYPVVSAVIGSNGSPLIMKIADEEVPKEITLVAEQAFYTARFEPARVGESPVPVEMRFRIPIKADFSEKDTDLFSLADVDEKPRAIQSATPHYPYELQQSNQKGRVVVEFILGADGSVHRARSEFFTHEGFRGPAIACVKNSVWEPAKKDGVPVACKVRIPIHFAP